MSTSGTYAFTVTRDDIITGMLKDIRKLDGIETADPQDIQDCAKKLNMLVKQWMGKADFAPGLKTFTRRRGYLFLSNSTGHYLVGPTATGWTTLHQSPTVTGAVAAGATTATLSAVTFAASLSNPAVSLTIGNFIGFIQTDGSMFWTTITGIAGSVVTLAAAFPVGCSAGAQAYTYQATAQNPLLIETVSLRDAYHSDTPVRMLTVQDYDMISNKTDPNNLSDPGAIYFEYQLGNSNLFIDCGGAQDVSKRLVITYMEPIQDFNNPLDNPEYPAEWYLPLTLGLGKICCPMYNKPWTALMEANFKASLAVAQHKDAERVTLYFQPGAED